MKICIFGAGAVGSHLAARLAKNGVDPVVVGRGAHVQAIKEKGLELRAASETFTVKVRATNNPATIEPQDCIIVTLKAHSLPGAADAISALVKPDGVVVYAQNGIPWWYLAEHQPEGAAKSSLLDPDGKLWNGVGVARAVGCVIYSPNEIVAPGVVKSTAPVHRYVLGALRPAGEVRVKAVAEFLKKGGWQTEISENIRADIWKKLLDNFASSSITCLTGVMTGEIATRPDLSPIFGALIEEGVQVARALGVAVEPAVEARLQRLAPMKAHRTSMLQDLEAKRQMEIDAQFTAVQELGRAKGIKMPVSDIIMPLVKHRARVAGLY